MRNARLDESQVGIKTVERNINHLRYADDTTLMVESEEESEKVGLKLNIQKTKIMASVEIDVETMATVTDFISWAPESLWMVTAAMKLKDVCSLEGKLWQI